MDTAGLPKTRRSPRRRSVKRLEIKCLEIKTAVCQSFCKLAYSGSFILMLFISILLLPYLPYRSSLSFGSIPAIPNIMAARAAPQRFTTLVVVTIPTLWLKVTLGRPPKKAPMTFRPWWWLSHPPWPAGICIYKYFFDVLCIYYCKIIP